MSGHHHGHHHGSGPDHGGTVTPGDWDERYRSAGALWSGRPNPHLVAEASGLAAGRALDAGCGEGADSLWLAGRGWEVTGVDFSAVALERAAERAGRLAADVAGRISWQHRDLTRWAPPEGAFDLVSVQFLHLPVDQREGVEGRLMAAVAPGGRLLVVGHDWSDTSTTVRRPSVPDRYFTAGDLAARLPADWTVVVSETRPRQVDDPDGQPVTVHDVVFVARRPD